MDNLIKDSTTLELFCWLEPGSELPGWDILKGGPFGATLASVSYTHLTLPTKRIV